MNESVRSKANRMTVAGHSRDRPPAPETLRNHPRACTRIIIQGNLLRAIEKCAQSDNGAATPADQ
jgi:hypothetical protein